NSFVAAAPLSHESDFINIAPCCSVSPSEAHPSHHGLLFIIFSYSDISTFCERICKRVEPWPIRRQFLVHVSLAENVRLCEGFRTTANGDSGVGTGAVVGKPPREGTREEVRYGRRRALWRFDRGAAGGRTRQGARIF